MADLKTDYIDPEWEGNRSYIKTTNSDGTVSFTDVTPYIHSGDYIESEDINTTNRAVNSFADLYKGWIGGSFTALKTNYSDSEFEGRKKFRMTDNGDNTVSFQDVTNYSAVGSEYSAADINATNTLINSLTNGLSTGITSIGARLRALGVTDISDLFKAIDTMVAVQTANGTAQGKNDVTTNPNAYGLYTSQQYNAVAGDNQTVRNTLKSVASTLSNGYNTNVQTETKDLLDKGGEVSIAIPYPVWMTNLDDERVQQLKQRILAVSNPYFSASLSYLNNDYQICASAYNTLNGL